MTRPLASIILYCGFRQRPRHAGLWALYERISRLCNDRLRYPLVAIREWDAPVKEDAKLVKHWDAEKLIVVGHSYGVGNATYHLQKHLDRPIDLLVSIDGVQRYGWFGNGVGFLPKLRAFRQGQKLRFDPYNVRRAASFITLNSAGWFCPMGHRITGPDIVRDVVYGGDKELASAGKMMPPGTVIFRDEKMTHYTIDDDRRVHDATVQLVAEELEIANARNS